MTSETYSWAVDYNTHSADCGREDTLSEAMAQAMRDATYYAIFCRAGNIRITIERRCAECEGSGEVANRVSRRPGYNRKRCPECKGKNSTVSIVENVPFEIHPNCELQPAK